MNTVQPALHDYKTAITANLQNKSPILIGNAFVEANLLKKDTEIPLLTEKREDIQFAPNSNFDFPIMWNNEPLKPGDYT